MLSHDVSSGPECCKPVTVFKSCENSGCADVLLTRRAANKEVQYDALVKSQQERVDAAMVREWDKWKEFRVTKFLSKKQLNDIMKRNHQMGLHGKDHQGKPDYKARLVVQGCQEDKGYIRTDAPTGSREHSQQHLKAAGITACSMPSQRTSSQTASRDTCCCGCLIKIRLLGRSQGKCLLLLVRSTGQEMLDVRGTSTARRCLRQLVLWSQSWNKVSTTCMDHLDLRLSCTHVDDFLSAFKKASKKYKDVLQHLVRKLHLKQQSGLVVYCGRTICRDGNHIKGDTNQVIDESRMHEH